jgi:hypothetical protein
VFTVLGTGPLWDAARRCHEALHRYGLAHAIVGGVAVALHGYRRTTADVDILIRSEDQSAIRQSLEAVGFLWYDTAREFRDAAGVPIQCLIALEPASRDSSLGVLLPDPSVVEVVTEIEGLSVISLAKLIEIKLACGLGDIRRSYRDWADVVELIVVRNLDHRFAGLLHKSVRKEYRAMVKRARGET